MLVLLLFSKLDRRLETSGFRLVFLFQALACLSVHLEGLVVLDNPRRVFKYRGHHSYLAEGIFLNKKGLYLVLFVSKGELPVLEASWSKF